MKVILKILKKIIHDILHDDGECTDESEIENCVDLIRDTTHRINGKKKFKHTRTPDNTPVDTSHSSNPSLSVINTPPAAAQSTQPPTISQLPTSTPPLLPKPYNKITFGPFDFFSGNDNGDHDNDYYT
jgi:hypothetical protein